MSPINLLPEEIRGEQKKIEELKPPQPQPQPVEAKMTEPIIDQQATQIKPRKRSWFSFLKKKTPNQTSLKVPEPTKDSAQDNLVFQKDIQSDIETNEKQEVKEPNIQDENPIPALDLDPIIDQSESFKKVSELAELLTDKPAIQTEELSKESKEKKEKEDKKIKPIKEIKPKKFFGSPEITLMPKKGQIIPRIVHDRLLLLLAVGIVLITVFGMTWIYADWHFDKMAEEVRRLEIESELLAAQVEPYLELRDRMIEVKAKTTRVEEILKNHIYWTKFFELLEFYTVPDVYFGNFGADISKEIALNATAKDLVSVVRQMIAFSNAPDFIEEVKISGISPGRDGISFNIDLKLVDDVFIK